MIRILYVLLLATSTSAFGQLRAAVTMERYAGESVKTDVGYNIVLNMNLSLKREWFVVRDPLAPVTIDGPAGFTVAFSDRRYEYRAAYKLSVKEPIVAHEIRFVVLDVFGQLLKTLSATHLDDFNVSKEFSRASWNIWLEAEAVCVGRVCGASTHGQRPCLRGKSRRGIRSGA